ncbi:MAG: nucleotidyl transferase AbiEii/AbiGii toxin family protein, partial [Chloroflexi bacterium]|nr:nucleotidyl transferase AbiEii/AbiGii toxin family protein [Chloroflexota bacterium]
MASLELPHWEATPSVAPKIVETIGKFPFCRRFFLGGGTSLALRLGHRISHDFDFFSDSDRVQEDTRDEILESLKSSFPNLEIATNTLGDLTLSIMGHDVGFYSYRYSMLETGDDLLGIKVAGLLDVASMKLDAIAGRGARRDFYDLYFLAHIFPLNADLHKKIIEAKKKTGSKAKVISGASGTWQYNYDPEKIEEFGIYALLEGELGGIAPEIDGHAGRFFNYLINGDFDNMNPFRKKSDFKVDIKEFERNGKKLHGRFVNFWDRPEIDEIPDIVEPSMHGMIEVMRGCGRGCKFCDVTLRALRYYPPEKVKREIEVNIKKGGTRNAWVHSDDIFVYGMDPRTSKQMEPNREALEELFTAIMSAGVVHTNPTHGTLAGAIADEKLIPNISRIIKSGPSNLTGIQCGFETGILRLIGKYADRKLAPFMPEEWHWVVKEGVKTLNEHYWVPAFTLIMGLDNDETPEDSWETISLISELER